jgi:hypothetical protein
VDAYFPAVRTSLLAVDLIVQVGEVLHQRLRHRRQVSHCNRNEFGDSENRHAMFLGIYMVALSLAKK